jgi:hypothetical protein
MNASTGSTFFNVGTGGPAHHANVSSYETAPAPSRETPDFAKRPLLNLQRKQSQIMRVSNTADSAVPSSGRPEDLYGVVPVPGDHPGGMHTTSHKNEGTQTTGSSSGGADPDEVAEQAWRIIAKRLVIEQERRGLTKWP